MLPVICPLAFEGVGGLADPGHPSAPHRQTIALVETITDPAYQGGMTMSAHGLGSKNI